MTALVETVWELPRSMRAAVQSQFALVSDAFDNPSPWTGERPRSSPFLQVWTADITPPAALSPTRKLAGFPSWREWQGFITRLRGTSGLLRVVDYYRMKPVYEETVGSSTARWSDGSTWSDGSFWTQGALPPFVVVDETARAEADSIVLRGLPPSVGDVLAPSDLMEGRPNGEQTPYGNLYEAVHATQSNSAGKARVYIQPGLHESFAPGDPFVLREPSCVFRLADRMQGIVSRSSGNVGRLGLKLIEHIRDA